MAKNLIGATWCDASNGEVIEITNPATNALIDTVPKVQKRTAIRLLKLLI